MKILIIEDEHVIATNLQFILERNSYECDIASDGEEGIEKIKSWLPDLVISDLILPKKDGLTIVKEVRNILKMVNLPFIFLTARADEKDKREGMNAGADDYITKPFAIKEILETIKKRLELADLKNAVLDKAVTSETLRLFNTISTNEYLTPLNSIINFSELLSNNFEDYSDEEKKVLLNNIHISGKKLNRSISKLFWFICLKDKKHPWYTKGGQTIVLPELMRMLALEFGRINKYPDIQIESTQENILLINYYQTDTVLMLGELVENIKKFTTGDNPASIHISANNQTITLTATNEYSYSEHAEITETIHMGHKNWTGAGIGLYLLDNWVKALNGTLTVHKTNYIFSVEITLPANLNNAI